MMVCSSFLYKETTTTMPNKGRKQKWSALYSNKCSLLFDSDNKDDSDRDISEDTISPASPSVVGNLV